MLKGGAHNPGFGAASPESFPFIPDHELLRCIGSGSYGKVFLARNVMGTLRAVKVIQRDGFAEARPFDREFAGIKKFEPLSRNHEGLVAILHMGRNEDAGYFYYIMELADDANGLTPPDPEHYSPRTLSCDLRGGQPLPFRRCIEICVSIAAALGHLHKNGLVHRDIKPSNIIFVGGMAKVADIGLVTEIGEAATFVGTEGYVPPEGPGKPLADIYSLGKVFYQMATGRPARDFPKFPPAPPRTTEPGMEPFRRLILEACHLDPAKRCPSTDVLEQRLRSLIPDEGPRKIPGAGGSATVSPAPVPRLRVSIAADHTSREDGRLASFLEEKLEGKLFQVLANSHSPGAVEWARRLEERVGESDAMIVVLSPESAGSEMLAYEIEMARDSAHLRNGKPKLLAVRLKWKGSLPEMLAGASELPRACSWERSQDDEKIHQAVMEALLGKEPTQTTLELAKLETVGGAVPLDSLFYVRRAADDEFDRSLAKHDSLVQVKGARQMGKTSLLARGLQSARESGLKVIFTDFQKLNAGCFDSLKTFYTALAQSVADQLDLDTFFEDIWDTRRSENSNFERYMGRHVLPEISTHLVWGLDEVDRLFSCPFSSEVFGLFRSWHNARAFDPTGPWSHLTLGIAYATEAHLFISDINQSPFNVGTLLELKDFSPAQVAELNRRHGQPLASASDIERFMRLVGGHPFLVRKGLNELVMRELTVDAFETEAPSDEGIFADHLRRILTSLARDASMLEAVQGILRGDGSVTPQQFHRLRSAGIMGGASPRELKPRCRLYEIYLARHLL